MGFCFLVGMIFYDHLIISSLLSLLGIAWIPGRKKELARRRKELVKLQFKDALYFISVSLSSGKSFETALVDAQRALERVYPDKNALIIKELELINARITMNISVEQAWPILPIESGWRKSKTLRMSSPFPNGQVST